MSERESVRDYYDAVVRVSVGSEWVRPFALVKETWGIAPAGPLTAAEARPLLGDMKGGPEREPNGWAPGSDFWPHKAASDVIVVGSVWAPDGRAARRGSAEITVGGRSKRVAAFGKRVLEWHGRDNVSFSEPEPFESVPLSVQQAYGGVDLRCAVEPGVELEHLIRVSTDHPGVYPRNPHGTGYIVLPDDPEGHVVELPGLEDPHHPLTPESILVRDPREWFRQPLPWFLGWSSPAQFPRLGFVGAEPWYPCPRDVTLEEVERGYLGREWRAEHAAAGSQPHPAFFQEASYGMAFANLPSGTPIVIRGMHPEHRELRFEVPRAPTVDIQVVGDRERCRPQLLHLVIVPDELRIEATWVARYERDAPRFMPGIHAEIPVFAHVNGDAPVPCVAPPTVRDQVRAGAAQAGIVLPPGAGLGVLSDHSSGRCTDIGAAPVLQGGPHDVWVGAVEARTGSVTLRTPIWESGGTGLALELRYSSAAAGRMGSLGAGWSHSLEQAVWERDGTVFYEGDDGRTITTSVPGGGELGIGAVVHDPDHAVTIRRIASDAYDVCSAAAPPLRFTRVGNLGGHASARARLTHGSAPDGRSWELRYDTRGRMEGLVLGWQQLLRFEHDEAGFLRRISARTADAQDWHIVGAFAFDAAGRLVEAVDASRRSSRYQYRGRLLSRVNRGDRTWKYVYEGSGAKERCVEEVIDDYRRNIVFDSAGRRATCIDAEGVARPVLINAARHVVRASDPFGNETTRRHDDATGLLVLQTTKDGESRFLYDAAHHLAEVVHPDGGSDALEHDAFGHLTFWANADGHAARWGWDHLGRLGAAIDRAGASVVYEYDEEGPLSAVLAPGEVRLMLIRDPRSHAVAELRSVTGSRYAMHDALTRIIETRDELGAVHRVRYDPCGRVAQVQLPTGAVRGFESDGDGRVTSVRDETGARVFERDGFGRIVHIDEGNGGARLHRDAEGRVTMVESEAGDFWELSRDAAGRAQSELGFSGEEVHIQRDHNGRIIRELRGATRSRVVRDVMGRPTNIEHGDETFQRFGWTKAGWLAHAQEADREVVLERDGEGRVLVEKQGTHWVRSEYDACGRRVRVSSSFGLVTAIERDVFGGAVSMTAERAEQRLELRFARDATGKERVRYLPGGLEARSSRDALGRVVERSLWNESGRISALGFTWAGVDRLVRVQEPGGVREHQHDARGRLVAARGQVRAMDEVGNVFRVRECDDHRYGPGGQLLEGYGVEYGYDAEGRRVEKKTLIGDPNRYRWDSLGRLVEVALSPDARVVYDYDAFGRMVRRRHEQRVEVPGLEEPVWDALRETQFIWDGLKLLHEIEGEQVTTWLWEEGVLVGKLDPEGAFAVLTDPLGMPTDVLDQRGEVAWRGNVDVFGVALSDVRNTSCPWRFPGHWEDPETGLSHSLFRVYDPETGAYLSPSPLGIAGGANLYAYVYDPLSEASPLGLARGYDSFAGALRSERLGAELVDITIRALDRGDGAAGPRSRFDPEAAGPILPDPEAILWGPWERYRPVRRLPPSTSSFTRLPDALGFNERD